MDTPLQDLVLGAGLATPWCCRRGADEPCSWEEGLAPMLCHSSSTSLPSCHGCAPDGGLMGLVLSPLPPKTALTLGVQQVSWREGHTHACVLQLCWRVCPHHLLPGMPVVCCLAQTCAWAFLHRPAPPGPTSLLSCLSSTCLAAGWAVLGSPLPSLLPFPAGLHGAHHHLPEHRSALQHGLSPGNH